MVMFTRTFDDCCLVTKSCPLPQLKKSNRGENIFICKVYNTTWGRKESDTTEQLN